jgi:hypothetical protein
MKKLTLILIIALSIGSCKKDEIIIPPKCDCGVITWALVVNDSTKFGYQVKNNCSGNVKTFWYKESQNTDGNFEKGDSFCKRSEFW